MISKLMSCRILAVALTCLGSAQTAVAELRVFACEPEWGALVLELVPDALVTSATHAGQDPHHIEARPSLIAAMRRADLAVCTGASLEAGWLPTLQSRASNPAVHDGRPGMFFASEHTTLIDADPSADRSKGDVHPEGNPHFHLDPGRLLEVARALGARIGEIRPAAAAAVQERLKGFEAQWNARVDRWREDAAPLRGRRVVVQHTAFAYLLGFLSMEASADLEPLPGLPPTVAHLQSVLESIGEQAPVAILQTTYQRPQPGEWLAQRSGLPLLRVPSTVTEAPETDTLAELYDSIIAQLLRVAQR